MEMLQATYKEAKLDAFRELVSIAFRTQADTYFRDGAKKGAEYLPDSEGDISRYTRRKSLSVKPFFSTKVIFSRSGETKKSLLDASQAAENMLDYKNEDVGYKIDANGISVYATSNKFAALEKAKSSGGRKGARNTTKKTWAKVVRFWAKTFKKRFATK